MSNSTYTIKPSDTDYRALRFAAAALSADPARPALRHLLVEDDDAHTAVGCDGRRLHAAPTTGLIHPGLYAVRALKAKVVLTPAADGHAYPNWRQVVPGYAEGDFKAATVRARTAVCQLARATGGVLWDHTFAADALGVGTLYDHDPRAAGASAAFEVGVAFDDDRRLPRPVMLKHTTPFTGALAVVMPVAALGG